MSNMKILSKGQKRQFFSIISKYIILIQMRVTAKTFEYISNGNI